MLPLHTPLITLAFVTAFGAFYFVQFVAFAVFPSLGTHLLNEGAKLAFLLSVAMQSPCMLVVLHAMREAHGIRRALARLRNTVIAALIDSCMTSPSWPV